MEGGLEKATQARRMQEAVDFHAQQEELGKEAAKSEPPEPEQESPTPPDTPADAPKGEQKKSESVQRPAKLRYASLDEGLVFLNPDGTRYAPASPQEETELQMAAAAHMATGEQSPDMPELELQMLTPEGKLPEAPGVETTPTPEPQQSREANKFQLVAEADGSGGLQNHRYQYVQPDGSYEKNADGSTKVFTQEEVEAIRSLRPAAQEESPATAAGSGSGVPPEKPDAGAGRDGYLDPHKIFSSPERPAETHARSGDWKIDDKQYIGIKVKRLQEILANETEQNDFGKILRAINSEKGDVLLRFRNGTATPDDMDFMTYGVHEYSKWSQKADEINKGLTSEDVELFGRRNADMRNLNTILNRGGELAYTKKLVMHMAMTDRAGLQEMGDAFKDLRRARDTARFRRSEEKRLALCKRLGINPNDYGPMFDLKNPEHRVESELRLANHIHEQAGGFRRAIDWAEKFTRLSRTSVALPGSSRGAAIHAVMQAHHITPNQRYLTSPTSWVLDTVDQSLHTIAARLGELAGNGEVRSAIQREAITNEAAAFEDERGPKTFSQVQSLEKQERYTEAGLTDRIKQFMQTDAYRKASTPAEQEAALSDFKASEGRESVRGRGFFAWLFSLVFGARFDKAASSALGRPVAIH